MPADDRTTSADLTKGQKYYAKNREWILARKAHDYNAKIAGMSPDELDAFRKKEQARYKEQAEKDPEKHRRLANERSRRYREANRERILARRKVLAEENREKLREQDRAQRKKDHGKILARKRSAYQQNREQELDRNRAYREGNREKVRHSRWKSDLKARFGLTPEMLTELEKQQNSRCAICRVPFQFSDKNIDHDHATGKVRGLLCGCCNRGLGQFGDDIRNMRRAIAYLKKHAANAT